MNSRRQIGRWVFSVIFALGLSAFVVSSWAQEQIPANESIQTDEQKQADEQKQPEEQKKDDGQKQDEQKQEEQKQEEQKQDGQKQEEQKQDGQKQDGQQEGQKQDEQKQPAPAESGSADAAKPAENAAPAAEAKPAEAQPAAAAEKPAEVKPAETKPAEAKPAEAKPAEAKPAETKPADAKPAEPKKEEKKYETETLKSEPLELDFEAEAVLWSEENTPVKITIKQGTVLKVKTAVPHGQMVRKGDTLVTFDTEDYKTKLAEKKLELQLARLNHKKAKLQLELARKESAWNKEVVQRSKGEAEDEAAFTAKYDFEFLKRLYPMRLKEAEMNYEAQKSELEQLEKMYKADDMTDETEEMVLRRQRRAVEVASFNLDIAKARFEWMDTRGYNRLVRDEKEDVRSKLAAIDTKIALLEPNEKILELEAQKAEMAMKKQEKEFHELEADGKAMKCVAPCDGMVFYGVLHNGKWDGFQKVSEVLQADEKLPADTEFLTIVNPQKVFLKLTLKEETFSMAAVGQKGFFQLKAYPERELPVVMNSLKDIPQAGTYEATATVTLDPAMKAFPGMRGVATLFAARKTNTLFVPESAVGRDTDLRRFVYVLNKDKNEPEKRFVQVGRKQKDRVEILDGLDPGMEVLKDCKKAN